MLNVENASNIKFFVYGIVHTTLTQIRGYRSVQDFVYTHYIVTSIPIKFKFLLLS